MVGIHIVTYNGLTYLPELFASLASQTYKDVRIQIRDNGSTDGTQEWLRQYTHSFFPNAYLELLDHNSGFVGAHNDLFDKITTQKYVLLINQDTVLKPDYVGKLMAHMETYPSVASCAGLILRFDGKKSSAATIDSAGITLKRNRKAVDIKAGETITHEHLADYPVYEHVFGVSGTLPMYRVDAIKKTGTLFDEDFIMYKEDVDVAHRLKKLGYASSTVYGAIAYHDRTVAQNVKRSHRTYTARYSAYRNHMWMLFKHETKKTFIPDAAHIISYETGKFFYLLFREPHVLMAWPEILVKARKMRHKAKRLSS